MNKIIRSSVFYGWCLCIALLPSAVSPVNAQPARSAIPSEIKTADFDGFPFPRSLAGLPRNGKVDYKIPGAGFSVSYGTPGQTWADIYVYDRQLDLSEGAVLPFARQEMDAALDDVRSAERSGIYQSVLVRERTATQSFTKAHLLLRQGNRERDSFVFITVHKGKFVKIRLTSNAGAGADRIAQKLLAEYSRVLRKN